MTRSTDFDATLVSADTDDLDAFVANGATRRRSLEGLLTTLSRQRNYLLSFNLQAGPPPSTVPALEETLTAIIETDRFVDDVSTALKDDGQTRGAGLYWQDLSFDLDQRNPDHELVALLVEHATIRAQELVDAHTHTTGGGRTRRTTIDLHDLATVLLYGPAESVPSPLLLEQLQATLGPDRFATLEQHLDEIAVHQRWANRTLTATGDGPISFNGDLASLDQQSQALLNESYRTTGGRNPTQRLDEPELAYQLQRIAEHDPARAITLKWALESSLTPTQQADIDRLLATGGHFGETIPLALRHPQQGAEGAAKSWWNQNFGWWTDTWADTTTAITYGFAGMAYSQSPTASPELTPNIPRTWAQVDEIVEMEFELDNLAQHGGADLATTIELASLAYGTTKGGITLTRIGTRYFLRSGDDIITELGPTTIRQLERQATGAPASAPSPAGLWNTEALHADELLRTGSEVAGPFPKAGQPGAVLFRRDEAGRITHYQIYDEDGLSVARVDLVGRAHGDIPTPHVQEYVRNTNPESGQTFVNKGPVRPARREELPT